MIWLRQHGLTLLSTVLIISGLVLIGASFYQQVSSEISFWWHNQQGISYSVDANAKDTKVKPIQPASTDFGLIIEKLNINEPVAAQIDPFNPNIYLPALERTPVAQAKGSVPPGQPGLTYLFAHSTVNTWDIGRYRAPFTLLNKLEVGDRIVTYFANQRYDYYVTDKKIVAPTDIEYMNQHPDHPLLILQTCDPPGENTHRLLIMAEMKQDN